METQIQGYSFSKRDGGGVSLFGYATKSMPGLEINGLGKYGKILKEKIIFITRSRQLPIPLKRFVISTEYELENDQENLRNLDFPVILLYWYLAGLIQIEKLDNCMAVGSISPSGKLISKKDDQLLRFAKEKKLLLIDRLELENRCTSSFINAQELLGHIPDISYE